jgi:hypothetical protein
MKVNLDSRAMKKSLQNIVNYSFGFLEGVQSGKKKMLDNLGGSVIFALGEYVDTMARANEYAMHHVYEWFHVGSPAARLFDLEYTVSNLGLSVKSTFRQSTTVSEKSTEPFYDKARIMENGIPVTITPKKKVLVFEEGGNTVFVSRPITVTNPGGTQVEGYYGRVFDSFFKNYFTQAFLKASGLFDYISKPKVYKKNIAAGAKGGRSVGKKVGHTWIVNAEIGAIR